MENNGNSLKERLLQKIHAREISMRPKLYFTLQIAALAFVALCVLVLSIFIFNFLLFTIRINSHDVLLGFGPRGFGAFLRFFPWERLVLDVALVVVLQWMLRAFKFGYKTPVMYLLLGLLGASAMLGFVVDRDTPFNDTLLREADEHLLPGVFGDFYGHARRPPPLGEGVCRCTITAIDGNTLTVQDPRSTTTLKVVLPSNDPRATTTSLMVGDTVLVAGDRDGGTIKAFGVRKVPTYK